MAHLSLSFKNLLTIHEVKTKEIITMKVLIWLSNLKQHRLVRFYSFNFSLALVWIDISNIHHTVSTHLQTSQTSQK